MAILCSGRKCSTISKILFFAAVALFLWFAWFGVEIFIGRKIVENGLQQLSAQLADMGSGYGKNIKLTYGKIDVKDDGAGKYAVVHDVNIEISSVDGGVKTNISTEDAEFAIDSANNKAVVATVSKPINVAFGGFLSKTFIPDEPLRLYYAQANDSGVQELKGDIVFPKKISMTNLIPVNTVASGKKEEVKPVDEKSSELKKAGGGYFINFDKEPEVQIIYVPERKERAVSYNFPSFEVSVGDVKFITVSSLAGSSKEAVIGADERFDRKDRLTISDAVLYKNSDSTSPYSLNVDTEVVRDRYDKSEYSVAMSVDPKLSPSKSIGSKINRDVTVNEFSLSGAGFRLLAKGKFSNVKGEVLPVGEVDIDIDNLPKFLDSELVQIISSKETVEEVLKKISGSLEGKAQISFPLKREKKGTFYVGNSTFEELAMPLLVRGMVPKNHSRLPDAPSSVGRPENDKTFEGDGVIPSAPSKQ